MTVGRLSTAKVLVRFRDTAATFEQARTADDVEADEVEALGLRGTRRIRARRLSTPELLVRLRANPDVEFVEPNYIIRLAAAPNEPSFRNLWGLNSARLLRRRRSPAPISTPR